MDDVGQEPQRKLITLPAHTNTLLTRYAQEHGVSQNAAVCWILWTYLKRFYRVTELPK